MQTHHPMLIETTNPATGERLESYSIFPDEEVVKVVKTARAVELHQIFRFPCGLFRGIAYMEPYIRGDRCDKRND